MSVNLFDRLRLSDDNIAFTGRIGLEAFVHRLYGEVYYAHFPRQTGVEFRVYHESDLEALPAHLQIRRKHEPDRWVRITSLSRAHAEECAFSALDQQTCWKNGLSWRPPPPYFHELI